METEVETLRQWLRRRFEEVEDRKFPSGVNYPQEHANDEQRAISLISRVMSLRPMKLANSMSPAGARGGQSRG